MQGHVGFAENAELLPYATEVNTEALPAHLLGKGQGHQLAVQLVAGLFGQGQHFVHEGLIRCCRNFIARIQRHADITPRTFFAQGRIQFALVLQPLLQFAHVGDGAGSEFIEVGSDRLAITERSHCG